MAVIERETLEPEIDGSQRFLWTKEQYRNLSELGLLEEVRVELIEGEIIQMPAIDSRHFTSVLLTTRALQSVFSEGFVVASQNGFNASPRSEPQPDVAVYQGGIRDFAEALPTAAVLIVEVADTTLRSDRDRKARLYASAGVPEYWIVNLRNDVLEVHRQPLTDAQSPIAYQSIQTLMQADTVTPLAASTVPISVADLLP
jgi:Uma2 family endonuclease